MSRLKLSLNINNSHFYIIDTNIINNKIVNTLWHKLKVLLIYKLLLILWINFELK
jgi:hypothetical protein